MLQLRRPPRRKGTGRSLCTCRGRGRRPRPAHARPPPEGWDAEGRAPPLRARTPARSLARPRRPEASPPALRVGATPARARVLSGRPEWPGSLGSEAPAAPRPGSRPTRPLPFLAEWGRRCSGSRVPDPARARSRAVSRCLARAALRSRSVSGAEGSVKRRPRFLFPFFSFSASSVGSSILRPSHPSLPLSRRGQLRLKAAAVGDGGRRRPPRSRLG